MSESQYELVCETCGLRLGPDEEWFVENLRKAHSEKTGHLARIVEADASLEREADHAPVDEQFLHECVDEIEQVACDPVLPIGVRLQVRDLVEDIRAELDPTRVRTEADE